MKNAPIQDLLDKEARLAIERYAIIEIIKQRRGDTAPVCYGQDDCGTDILARCPWRIDCGEP